MFKIEELILTSTNNKNYSYEFSDWLKEMVESNSCNVVCINIWFDKNWSATIF